MVSVSGLVVVLVGAVLLFFGGTLSVYGVGLLGLVVGGAGGYFLAPTLAGLVELDPMLATAAAAGVGALLGVVVTYALLSFAVAAVSFAVGAYAGLAIVAPTLGTWAPLAALGTGIAAALVGSIFTKTTMVVITALAGAAFVSLSITLEGLSEAGAAFTLDPLLFQVSDPVFVGLFVLGILTQFGLFKFGYVAKLLAILPGARRLRGRGSKGAD